jgi:hypothetical protein
MKLKVLLEDVTFTRGDESVDQQIDELIYDAERVAVQSAMKTAQPAIEERISNYKLDFLFEEKNENAPPFDVAAFANEIIRCLMMYQKVMNVPGIIDIPTVVLARTKNFLKTKYGDEVLNEFESILGKNADMSGMITKSGDSTKGAPPNQPLAVGAGGGGGAA